MKHVIKTLDFLRQQGKERILAVHNVHAHINHGSTPKVALTIKLLSTSPTKEISLGARKPQLSSDPKIGFILTFGLIQISSTAIVQHLG